MASSVRVRLFSWLNAQAGASSAWHISSVFVVFAGVDQHSLEMAWRMSDVQGDGMLSHGLQFQARKMMKDEKDVSVYTSLTFLILHTTSYMLPKQEARPSLTCTSLPIS